MADQLRLLQRARTWYLDGTFYVANKPFTQLWSVHAFRHQGDTTKRVPLRWAKTSSEKARLSYVLRKIVDILAEAPAVEAFTMNFEAGKGFGRLCERCFLDSKYIAANFIGPKQCKDEFRQSGYRLHRRNGKASTNMCRSCWFSFLPSGDVPRSFQKLKDRSDFSF
ncbi:hypothetical protein MAR_038019 [Mya arenaria]|uniref:Uncharacterized protein n=1 Tax=Mya arenaria TaxID=6604 RepID=A0ABY7FQ67_MYAAR|nr:hypothetical protein MAR_038019 [Mya arenaria]